MRAILVAAIAVLTGGLAALALITLPGLSSSRSQITQLQSQVKRQHQEIQKQTSTIQEQGQEISTLNTTSGSAPSDPLSAYSDICNEQFTNQQTGVQQTYYLPCTNNAQTIPQPGD
jgi:TolA-binding protein